MTGLDLISVQDAIATHVSTAMPSYEVKEDYVLDDEQILKLDNRIKPFIVLRWHGLNRSPQNASFAGARFDEYNSAVDVIVVAPNPRISRQALNYVMGELIGWQVPGGSELTPSGGQSVASVPDYQGKPHLYLAVNTLTFQVNSDGVGT
jgi:hypothetical protein